MLVQIEARTGVGIAESAATAIAVALGLSLILGWSMIMDVWHSGQFIDPDDAARMVQVRDWMAGQPWYDLHMHRLGFPGAADMHWSRIVDVPVAALVRFFETFLEAPLAERAARIAFPLLMLASLFFVAARIAADLIGPAGVFPALVVLALSGLPLAQFQPGRIDHHAPQIVLLLVATLLLLRSISVHAFRNSFFCGAALSLSLAISVENIGMTAVIAAAFTILWAIEGHSRRDAMIGFALGVICTMPAILALTIAPANWLRTTCDAASIAHLTLALTGAACCLLLASFDRLLSTRLARWAGVTVAAAMLPMLLLLMFPSCAGDPYTGLDPAVRAEWLDRVAEARSLAEAMRLQPGAVLLYLLPALVGLGGICAACRATAGEERLSWILLACVSFMAMAVASWKVGSLSALAALASLGTAWIVTRLRGALRRYRILAAAALSGMSALLLLPAAQAEPTSDRTSGCLSPEAFTGIASLPAGRLLAPINYGAHLLAFTQHSVIAGPYHRNNEGNRLSVDAFRLPLPEAMQRLQANGVDYVAICAKGSESPLGEALSGDRQMDGLARISLAGPFMVWRIVQ